MFSNPRKTVSALAGLALPALLLMGCSSGDDTDDTEDDSADSGVVDAAQASDAAGADAAGSEDSPCGDGPAREGDPGDSLIRLRPLNDVEQDADNLQWAVDSVAAGGTLELCEGTFFLGEGDAKRSVSITKGIHIVGKKDSEDWLTVIEGGGTTGAIVSGPIQLNNDGDSNPNIFEKLWLRKWTSEAINITAVRGFTLENSRISHPVMGGGPMSMVHAIFSRTPNCQGDFIVRDNQVELGNYAGALPVDEQLLGVLSPAHDNIRIINNTITGLDEALEVLGNSAPNPGEIVIRGNTADMSFELGDAWPGKVGLMVGGNQNTESVLIEDNVIKVRGPGKAIAVSGENLTIRNNTVELGDLDGVLPVCALQVGLPQAQSMGLISEGSLSNSVVEDNEFTGAVQGQALYFDNVPGVSNESHNNTFKLGESLAEVESEITIYIAPEAHDNTFEGNVGNVQDDSPEGANTY